MLAGDRIVEAAYARLSGDSTLSSLVGGRISRDPEVPPPDSDTTYPYIALGIQSATPFNQANADRVYEDVVLRVRATVTTVSGQGWGLLRQICDRLDTLLQGYGMVTVSGIYVVKLRLAAPYFDDVIRHDGASGVFDLQRVFLYTTEAEVA
jgi:hypothetical protein